MTLGQVLFICWTKPFPPQLDLAKRACEEWNTSYYVHWIQYPGLSCICSEEHLLLTCQKYVPQVALMTSFVLSLLRCPILCSFKVFLGDLFLAFHTLPGYLSCYLSSEDSPCCGHQTLISLTLQRASPISWQKSLTYKFYRHCKLSSPKTAFNIFLSPLFPISIKVPSHSWLLQTRSTRVS